MQVTVISLENTKLGFLAGLLSPYGNSVTL
jgi:hypothetical protein